MSTPLKTPIPPSSVKPDNSELWSLAETLGIELPQEKHLLYIVRAAMKAELPPNWTQHKTTLPDGTESPYYFNQRTGQSVWFRPITSATHAEVKAARASGITTAPPSAMNSARTSPSASGTSTPNTGGGGGMHTKQSQSLSNSSSLLVPTRVTVTAPSSSSQPHTARQQSNPSSRPLSARASQDFSLETQQALLANMSKSNHLKYIRRIQEFFRRWREKKQKIIKAKVRVGRATMDADMMARLAGGKRRTLEGSKDFLSTANISPGAMLGSFTVPTTPNIPGTPVNGSDNPNDPAEQAKAKKRRASMMRMLSIQNRFNVDGVEEAAPAQDSSLSASAPIPSATSSSSSSLAPPSDDGDASDRRGVRLNTRRRTLNESLPANGTAASASSSSKSPTTSSSSRQHKTTLRNWQFIKIVLHLQRKFQKKRAELRARVAQKVATLQVAQTTEADRRLRRASLPMSDLNAVRKRLSGQPAPAASIQMQLSSVAAQAK